LRAIAKGFTRMSTGGKSKYKWVILIFLILIYFAIWIQLFAIPVLFPMIGSELHLSVAQLGLIWGMWTLGGVFLALPGGLLGDIIGVRITIFLAALIVAIASGARGLASEATLLSAMMFVAGGLNGWIFANAPKAIFMWFPPAQLGLANGLLWGIGTVGMAVGAGISATIVVPALGSWQSALFLYAAILLGVAVGWFFVAREPAEGGPSLRVPFAEAVSKTIRNREVWLCAIAYFGAVGLNMGFSGYLPTYLQNMGWTVAASSTSLTAFMLASIITSILVPSLSDRFKLRKVFFIVPSFIFLIAVGMVALIKATMPLWTLFIIAGLGFGALVPMLNSIIAETKGVGAMYAGAAIGIGVSIAGLGGWFFPTVGGHLAMIGQTLPFIFGPILFLVCLVPFFFTRDTKIRE
jgi:nitrate/nitrite transporter NarK